MLWDNARPPLSPSLANASRESAREDTRAVRREHKRNESMAGPQYVFWLFSLFYSLTTRTGVVDP
jgi:hypothetical protein